MTESYRPREIARPIPRETVVFTQGERVTDFSIQEARCLSLIAQGFTKEEIGQKLNIEPLTVKGYLNRTIEKREKDSLLKIMLDSIRDGTLDAETIVEDRDISLLDTLTPAQDKAVRGLVTWGLKEEKKRRYTTNTVLGTELSMRASIKDHFKAAEKKLHTRNRKHTAAVYYILSAQKSAHDKERQK